jgi:prevent-host-death family protein
MECQWGNFTIIAIVDSSRLPANSLIPLTDRAGNIRLVRLVIESVARQQVDQCDSKWQLQDAKARFSELVKRAREEGPQHVSVRGEPAVVVVSEKEFAKLTSPCRSIVDHILEGELWPDDLVDAINDRSRDPGRDVPF